MIAVEPVLSDYFYRDGEAIRCVLCPRRCKLVEGEIGSCLVRKNEGGRLVVTNYGECSSLALDPIEKKPLFHFYPGSVIFSAGTVGCNLHCIFCQNWQISQQRVSTQYFSPEALVEEASQIRGNLGIAFTYNEPLIWFEYVRDTARVARERGLKTVLVTSGTICEEPLEEILPLIDAMNVDLKAIRQSFYSKICEGFLKHTKHVIKRAWEFGCLVETTNLIIPGHNDSEEELEELTDWVASVSPDLPLHFSRYFPHYKLRVPPTPAETLERAWEIGSKKLNYVYVGNLGLPGKEDTYCKACKRPIVRRHGYFVEEFRAPGGKCGYCGAQNYLVC